jgi:biotin carboxylase
METTMERDVTFLCLASYFKGVAFLEEAKAQGCKVILLTQEKHRNEAWPTHAIDETFYMPQLNKYEEVQKAVSYLARERQIDRIFPLDDYDVEIAARVREHLRLPGMGDTTARYFRDKLAMRVQAKEHGVRVPEFVHVLNHNQVHEFTQRVHAPWVLKPRSEAGSVGIKKCHSAEELWEFINQLGDLQSQYLVEAYVAGDVYHVDSVVFGDKILFSQCHRYDVPPFNVWNHGGVFATRTLPGDAPVLPELLSMNDKVIKAMHLVRGVTHAEFIHSNETGEVYYLEMAARVGGASIDVLVDKATGVNLWKEWVKLELADLEKTGYKPPKRSFDHAALMLCLANDPHPDLSSYDAPEVRWKLNKEHHAGLIVAGPDYARVQELSDGYIAKLQHDFLLVRPPSDTAV